MHTKTKVILSIFVIILLLTFAGVYIFLHVKWHDEAVAIQEINNISLRYHEAPKEVKNPNDPPLNSNIWYDRSIAIENAITGIDQGKKEIENAVKIGYLGSEVLPLIKMPIDLLSEKSKTGEASSQYVLGIRKKIGAGIEKDTKEYQRLLKLSANSHFPLALREMALNLRSRHNADKDKTQASIFVFNTLFETYLLDAAKLKDPVAMYFLADFYYFSSSEKGRMTAGLWLEKCLKENFNMTNFLCHRFLIKYVSDKDRYFVSPSELSINDSYNYVINLAQSGLPAAQALLAEISWDGQIPENHLKMPRTDAAMMWHYKAANAGRMESQKFLGLAYSEGKIIPRDFSKASYWLDLAASQGAYSATHLGMSYSNGYGVAKDQRKAVKWLTIGALFEDDKNSQYQIGQFYWNGLGVPKNLLAAYAWINVSNTSGSYEKSLSILKGDLSDSEVLKAEELSGKIFELIQKHNQAKKMMSFY